MGDYTETALWKNTLSSQPKKDDYEHTRDLLRNAYLGIRGRAAAIANEIHRDLPGFTVHDITHIDALWEMADLLTSDRIAVNPLEAFVLGSAFLVHDLGMGLAAYPGGIASLKNGPLWQEVATGKLNARLGRRPSLAEIDEISGELESDILADVLRLRHAERAAELPFIEWASEDGKAVYYLIENPDLRTAFGSVIGDIAYSHWWSIDEVRRRFAGLPLLAPHPVTGCPREWGVDRLKLACILRASDAIHIDARRAAGFVKALRKPSHVSKLHWDFQQHVHLPQVMAQRVEFSSGHRFEVSEARAWWLGYELLLTASNTLREVETLFRDMKLDYSLTAHSVAGIEEPERLTECIPTSGWIPVDARVTICSAIEIVKKFGGSQLYGTRNAVPLRELVQMLPTRFGHDVSLMIGQKAGAISSLV